MKYCREYIRVGLEKYLDYPPLALDLFYVVLDLALTNTRIHFVIHWPWIDKITEAGMSFEKYEVSLELSIIKSCFPRLYNKSCIKTTMLNLLE